jgi:hypothetical protein
MDNFDRDSLANLDLRLKASADAARPEFSSDLHERILAAIDDCEMLPLHSWASRWRQPLAIAASLLALVTGSVLAGYSLTGGFKGHGPSDPPAMTETAPPAGTLAMDSDLMQRALAAADHWGWLDEDSRDEAAWFVADMPLDLDASDAAAVEEDDAELGS